MPNILIIDDEVDLCEIYTDALTNVGHQVSTVHNATDAIKLLPHLKPNIVLLDMHLKGDSGSFVLSFIRK